MTDDLSTEDLHELLGLWWRYERQHDLSQLGYPRECPSTRGYRSGGSRDDDNGAADVDARGRLAQRVGTIVERLEPQHRAALHVLARNAATGVSVWRSARLPSDTTELQRVIAAALAAFAKAL